MFVHISWLVPQRVILVKASGSLTPEGREKIINEVCDYIEEGIPPVHYIGNLLEIEKIAFFSLRGDVPRIQRLLRNNRVGWVVLCLKPRSFTNFIVNIISRFATVDLQICYSLEEAVTFLKQQDETLEWETQNENHLVKV